MEIKLLLNTLKSKIVHPYYAFCERNSARKVLHLRTVVPMVIDEVVPLKDLRDQPITFWDYENSSIFDISEFKGHLFVVGNLNTSHLENISKVQKKNKHNIQVHLFDTKHTQKNYADILIASLVGEILQACGTVKEVNLISKDKGFESIEYFLKSQGLKNVNIFNQTNTVTPKIETFKKIVEANYIKSSYVSLASVLKTAKSLKISESEVYKILQENYKYDYDYATDKVKIRYK